jgi:DNA-binding CsgD family transcriptional regulator
VKKQILILAIISSFQCVYSNNPHIVNIYREDYQADNKNWAIAQDEKGILYFGNDIGLLEFDGVEWRLNELPNKLAIRSVAVFSHNTLFSGSYEEFGRWDRDISGKFVYTSLSNQIDPALFRNDDFWKIWIAGDSVYFQSFTSIYVYDYKTIRQIPSPSGFLFLSKVRNEFLVQQMLGVLCRLDGLKLQAIPGSEIFQKTDARVILPYKEDQYLIGTARKGLYLYDGNTFREWNPALTKLLASKDLNCGILASDGNYYFGTISGGVYQVDTEGKVMNHISSENTLQNNTVLALHEDDSGNIWVALDRGIAYIHYIKNMSCYTGLDGTVGAVYDAALWQQKLFIATNQGVLYVTKEDWHKLNNLQNLKLIDGTQGQVWALKVIDGQLYCCHNKGLKEIDHHLNVRDIGNVNTGVYNVKQVRLKGRDQLFLATYFSLKIWDVKTGTLSSTHQIDEPVRYVETDHLGNIWLEHANKGVYRCQLNDDDSDFRSFSFYGEQAGAFPYKLKLFKMGGRIELLGDGHFYTYHDIEDKIIPNKLLNECFKNISHLKQIVAIGDNTFWALANHSIYRFFYDGYKASILEYYDLDKDMSLVNLSENVSILNDSTHLICLDNGFLLYNYPPQISNKQVVTRAVAPYIESIQTVNAARKASYLPIDLPAEISYKQNHVIFRFSAKNTFTDNLLFQYMLTGVDQDWSAPQKINSVDYARLPKGQYEFRVRTIDQLGNYSEATVYPFDITPPWFLSTGAYVTYFLLFVLLFYLTKTWLLKRYQNKHLQKIKNRETKHLKFLTEKLKNEVETKNAELFSQSSFIIQKNELILKIKNTIGEFYSKNKNASLIPLYQRINLLMDSNFNSEEDWKRFLIKFEEKHTTFFKNLKLRYPQLTHIDLRLCACLKLNMETKEIASLMNLSVRAVENSRYRLRKKLNLPSSQNLNEFFFCLD